MASLSETRGRIRFIVTDRVGCIAIDRDGDLTFPAGHARMFIAVKPFGRSHVVDVTGITNWEVARHRSSSSTSPSTPTGG